ncbi:hypothetical protein B0T10DRAFT_215655 [Thelonectria olida]|uniref:RNase H type-1 domain-containing protein n=1 Tax=Thelonectria olida TaxID=1576542 RepID=A0A9P8WBA8_9HYPO|nr:hypothetical protein B0T10DRAFT_215655 [Thelonectria olida]
MSNTMDWLPKWCHGILATTREALHKTGTALFNKYRNDSANDGNVEPKRDLLVRHAIKKQKRAPAKMVTIRQHREALIAALLEPNVPGDTSQLILWTDASMVGHRLGQPVTGWAVACRRCGTWVRMMGRSLDKRQTVNSAELLAIVHALLFANQLIRLEKKGCNPQTVRIYTDSQSSLFRIGRRRGRARGRPGAQSLKKFQLVKQLTKTALEMVKGLERCRVKVEFHWVPRGTVEGNIVADWAARESRSGQNMAAEEQVLLDWNLEAEGNSDDHDQPSPTGSLPRYVTPET